MNALRQAGLGLEEKSDPNAAEVLAACRKSLRGVEPVKSEIHAPAPAGEHLDATAVHEIADGAALLHRAGPAGGREGDLRFLVDRAAAELRVGSDPGLAGQQPQPAVQRQDLPLDLGLVAADRRRRTASVVSAQFEKGNEVLPGCDGDARARGGQGLFLRADGRADAGNRDDGPVGGQAEGPAAGDREGDSAVSFDAGWLCARAAADTTSNDNTSLDFLHMIRFARERPVPSSGLIRTHTPPPRRRNGGALSCGLTGVPVVVESVTPTMSGTRQLTSWKEIAHHLEVNVRTAQKWEREKGLPVRRVPGARSRVNADAASLDAWKQKINVAANHQERCYRWPLGPELTVEMRFQGGNPGPAQIDLLREYLDLFKTALR